MRLWIVLALLAVTATASRAAESFSQYQGFKEYFAANPRADAPPSLQDQELLFTHRPRFFLPKGHAGMVSFYGDYIAQGHLRDGQGKVISKDVTRAVLNAHKNDPNALFKHLPDAAHTPVKPVVFGRIDRRLVEFAGKPEQLTFLTYNAVFTHSGLPAGLSWWQKAGLAITDMEDWHQLDHYTAASVVLIGDGQPLALMLQQHNYQHTYLFGESIEWPKDGRVSVDVAIRSNELYPHAVGRIRRRAISIPTPKAFRYLIGDGPAVTLSADDITEPALEQAYDLAFLAQSDAFYSFQGFLGEKRLLPGRDGPPGADYKTLPEFMAPETQLFISYWRENHPGDIARFRETILKKDYLGFARQQKKHFYNNYLCLQTQAQTCQLR